MNYEALHVVFAGGGTLGHLFPGLAVAAELRRLVPEVRICFAGCGKPAEQRQVLLEGYEYLPLACCPRPQRMLESLRFVAENARGLGQAARYLQSHTVSAVVGLGGYASYPMARAAIRSHIPLVLLEQNAVPGHATRHLAPHAQLICLAFEEARRQLRACGPMRVTGTPVRHASQPENNEPAGAEKRQRRLLVVGGSQGAQSLNRAVPHALARLQSSLNGWSILHQTGEAGMAATSRLYGELGIDAHVRPFVENLPRVMSSCALAISRAGGTTLAELATAGLPAIVVPYPSASEDHQRRNAAAMAARGGCRVVDEEHGLASLQEQLFSGLSELLTSPEARRSMRSAQQRLARPTAAWHVAQMILDQASAPAPERIAA